MAFGPESTNPREMRAYAHVMIGHLAAGEVNYGEAMDAVYHASLTVKGAASGFEGALENAAAAVETNEQGASSHRTIRRVPLGWQHPTDENGQLIPLFDTRGISGKYTLSEMTELAEDGSDFAKGNMHSAFMPMFKDVPQQEMGVSLYEITTEGTTRPDESQAWDLAHDEKYRREGKTALLRNPIEIQLLVGTHKTEVIEDLHTAYLLGEHVSADFNDDRMSSREIGELGIDGAYTKYFGTDKKGYAERERLKAEQYDLEQIEETNRALEEVPELVEQTAEIVNPDIADKWRQCLEARARDLYHGSDSKSAIGLMRAHSQGASQAELKQKMDEQGHSGASAAMTLGMIKHFYKAGDSLTEMLA